LEVNNSLPTAVGRDRHFAVFHNPRHSALSHVVLDSTPADRAVELRGDVHQVELPGRRVDRFAIALPTAGELRLVHVAAELHRIYTLPVDRFVYTLAIASVYTFHLVREKGMENKKMIAFRFSSRTVERLLFLIDHFDSPDMRAAHAFWRRVTKTSVLESLVNAEFERVELAERALFEKQLASKPEKKKPARKKGKVKS